MAVIYVLLMKQDCMVMDTWKLVISTDGYAQREIGQNVNLEGPI